MKSGTACRWGLGIVAGAVGAAVLGCAAANARAQTTIATNDLPDAPSYILSSSSVLEDDARADPDPQSPGNRSHLPPCHQAPDASQHGVHVQREADGSAKQGARRGDQTCQDEDPVQSIVTQRNIKPLTPREKAQLAGRDIIDPFNLVTIVGYSGISVAADSHSAYGPGFAGWGRLTGYALAEDVQGEFFGTFLIPSLVHEDPRYHRMPDAPFKRRLLHAVAHTVVSRHDDGRLMPNYATLGTYPISALLTNAYVPGIATSPADTGKRIGLGLATDPVGAIVAEFLPDVAKRIHVRVVFVQEIINQIATQSTGPSVQ